MIKCKIQDIINFHPVLEKLFKLSEDEQIKFELALKILRLHKILAPEYKEYQTIQTEILKKYGTPREDQVSYEISNENREKFEKHLKALHNLEIEVAFEPFTEKDFNNTNFLSAMEIYIMGPFITLSEELIDEKLEASFSIDSLNMEI